MLPVLHARESIHRVNELIYGTGHMDEHEGRTFIRELQELAAGESREKPFRPSTIQEMQQIMGGLTKIAPTTKEVARTD